MSDRPDKVHKVGRSRSFKSFSLNSSPIRSTRRLSAMFVSSAPLVLLATALVSVVCQSAPRFSTAHEVGQIRASEINEASGLAASRLHPGVLYTQNDKGDSSRIFALSAATGILLATIHISGVRNYDWEDLAVGPCPGGTCIFIAETGDHGGDGALNIIHRVNEPTTIKNQSLSVASSLHFTWSEQDCECVMVDPVGNTYIASKVHWGHGLLAKLPSYGWGGTPVAAGPSYRLTINSTHYDPNGCDISPNGKEMLIKARNAVYFWNVPNGDYIEAAKQAPQQLPYHHEHRGETVAWSANGDGYYTLGEGRNQPLYYYRRQ